MKISIIVAVDDSFLIGKKNGLPWYLPADLQHFKKITTGHPIIMGQTTHKSIGKVLPDRTNVVMTLDKTFKSPGCKIVYSLEEAVKEAKKVEKNEAFFIGGASVFKQALPLAQKLYLTKIHHNFDGDVYFPKFDEKKWKMISCEKHESDEKNKYPYEFCVYVKK